VRVKRKKGPVKRHGVNVISAIISFQIPPNDLKLPLSRYFVYEFCRVHRGPWRPWMGGRGKAKCNCWSLTNSVRRLLGCRLTFLTDNNEKSTEVTMSGHKT